MKRKILTCDRDIYERLNLLHFSNEVVVPLAKHQQLNKIIKNREKIRQSDKERYQKVKDSPEFKEKRRQNYLRFKEIRRGRYQEKRKIRYHNDINYRLKVQLGARVRQALRYSYKSLKTIELIGCSIEHLKQHIESQFLPGMTWENHGVTGWHIDHILPCDSFDLTSIEQQKICFNWKNLQPMWYQDNIRKGNKILK